jgi:circadian clock protein KaiB
MLSPIDPPERVHLILFVAKAAPRTAAAIENLQGVLAGMPPDAFRLEIVNVSEQPERALDVRVMVTPTLIAPGYAGRLVGDLSERERLRYFLETLTKL